MGQGQSDGSSAAQSPFDSIPANDRHGWKVMQVMAHSPSSGLGVVPYFSVLTHIDGVRCGRDESDLFPLIKENQAAQLTFLNLATLTNRTVTVTPRRGWGGDGLLGLMIRHDWFENAHLETIHVLDVHHGSPAEAAGLRAHVDYLLGTSRLAFKGYDSLDLFLTQYNGVDGRVVVFNKDSFSVREVTIKPSNTWGGAGSLGCDVACGFLHQLPLDGKRDVYFEGEGPGAAAAAGVAGIPQPVQTQPIQPQQQFVPQQPQQGFPQQQQQFQNQQFQQQQVFDPTQPQQQQFAHPQAVYDPTQQQFAQQQFGHPQQQQQQFHQQQVAFDPTQLQQQQQQQQQQHLSPQHVQQHAEQQAQHQVAFDPTQLAAGSAHQQHQQHQPQQPPQQQHAAFPVDPAAPAAAPVEAQQPHVVTSPEQHIHQQQSPPQQQHVPQQQHHQQFHQQQHAQPAAAYEPVPAAAPAPVPQPAAAAAAPAGAPQFSPEQMQQFLAWQAQQQQQQQFGQVTVPQRGGLP